MISMDKKYRTRGGLEVEIYRTDAGSQLPVIGAYKTELGDWNVFQWGANGQAYPLNGHHLELIEIKEPKRVEVWFHSYDGISYGTLLHNSKHVALGIAATDALATIGIELLIHDDGRKEARIIEVV